MLVEDGKIRAAGPAAQLLAELPDGVSPEHFPDLLIMPGFIDPHIHYPQTQVIASYGAQLLEWLEKYTFVEEQKFADPAHAARNAEFFLDELARNGTTTAVAYCSAHPGSAEALFATAHQRNAGMIAGNAVMNRNGPPGLLAAAPTAIADSRDLIQRWHGKGRQRYAVTPRFAITSTEEQLAELGALLAEYPTVLMQTHLAENLDEIATVKKLFPNDSSYTAVYARFGLLGPRSLLATAFISASTKSRCCATAGRSRCSARRRICSSAADCSTMTALPPRACASRLQPMSAAARPTRCCAPRPKPTR